MRRGTHLQHGEIDAADVSKVAVGGKIGQRAQAYPPGSETRCQVAVKEERIRRRRRIEAGVIDPVDSGSHTPVKVTPAAASGLARSASTASADWPPMPGM